MSNKMFRSPIKNWNSLLFLCSKIKILKLLSNQSERVLLNSNAPFLTPFISTSLSLGSFHLLLLSIDSFYSKIFDFH